MVENRFRYSGEVKNAKSLQRGGKQTDGQTERRTPDKKNIRKKHKLVLKIILKSTKITDRRKQSNISIDFRIETC